MIRIQEEDFCLNEEYERLRQAHPSQTGAIVTFIGLVRDFGDENGVSGLELEHYEGMTQKSLQKIIDQASQRWELLEVSVIHRVGKLALGDQIVFVGVSAHHRKDAFHACEYVMDYLKARATIWKKEQTADGSNWVESKKSDADQVDQWLQK